MYLFVQIVWFESDIIQMYNVNCKCAGIVAGAGSGRGTRQSAASESAAAGSVSEATRRYRRTAAPTQPTTQEEAFH